MKVQAEIGPLWKVLIQALTVVLKKMNMKTSLVLKLEAQLFEMN